MKAVQRVSQGLRATRLLASIPMYTAVPPPLKPRYAAWMRREIETTGCLYVKIGQWVASRTDIFSEEITLELQKLQAGASPMDPEDALRAIADSGFEFESFDVHPVSSGSIACVYKAVYEGREVAVKVQRPGIVEALERDVGLVRWLVDRVQSIGNKMHDDVVSSLEELLETVRHEVDFEAEVRHMRLFKAHFDAQKEGEVVIPEVIVRSSDVIVMEYVDSVPFTGSPTVLLGSFFDQFFELGWLHTDMHAGNIGQTPDGKLVLYDFGSVMKIPESMVLGMKALMVSYLNRNTDLMLQYMLEYGYLIGTPTEDDMEMLRTFITNILDYVEITDIEQFTALMKTAPVSSNPNVTFSNNVFMIIRSFTLLEGLCKSVDPDFVIIDALMPVMLEMAVDPFMLRLKIEDDVRHVLLSFFGSQKNMKDD